MPQKRIHCPSHIVAASSFSNYTCTSHLLSVPVPDVLSLSQVAGQNTVVENVEKKIERTQSFCCTGHTRDRRELETGTTVSEIKDNGRSAQQCCGELGDVMEESWRHGGEGMVELCWERCRRYRESWD